MTKQTFNKTDQGYLGCVAVFLGLGMIVAGIPAVYILYHIVKAIWFP